MMRSHSTRTPFFPENLQDYAPWVSIHGLFAPYGKCQCGCGQDAPVSPVTRRKMGYVQGQPSRVLVGHKAGTETNFTEGPNPSGLCMCGCGQLAPIAKLTDFKAGVFRGKPVRFLFGHYKKSATIKEQEFWEKVDKRGPDECWPWTGSDNGNGYGRIGDEYAHRLSYKLHRGPIPDGIEVCHSCDANYPPGDTSYRCCVNPAHLFEGTRQDNVDDMVAKGRIAHGDRAGQSKLRECEAVEIIVLLHGGDIMHKDIAAQFGTSRAVVSGIWRDLTWKHLPRPWSGHHTTRDARRKSHGDRRFRFGGQR